MKHYPIHFHTCANGETIAYRTAGDKGPIVVLVHGNMSSSVHWQTTMEQLENDYQLIVPDMRGFGDSSYHSELNSLLDFGSDLLDLLNALKVETCFTCRLVDRRRCRVGNGRRTEGKSEKSDFVGFGRTDGLSNV
jgi:pimeloyl-ACP methyl ester carboxylesterase